MAWLESATLWLQQQASLQDVKKAFRTSSMLTTLAQVPEPNMQLISLNLSSTRSPEHYWNHSLEREQEMMMTTTHNDEEENDKSFFLSHY